MAKADGGVESYMAALEHPFKAVIEALRQAVLAQDPARITESVKWNAPNFVYDGEDRATLRLQPGDRLELILHRGAKARSDASDFAFADPTGTLTWLGADRALLVFPERGDALERVPATAKLVHSWMRACS